MALNAKSQKKCKAWNIGNRVCILFVMLLFLAQPVYSASVLGDFGKVEASNEQSQAQAGAVEQPKEDTNTQQLALATMLVEETGLEQLQETAQIPIGQSQGIALTNPAETNSDTGGIGAAAAGIIRDQQASGSQTENISAQVSLADWKLAKEVESTNPWEPKRVTSVFSKNDYGSFLWTRLESLYQSHNIKWQWHDPSGAFYSEATHTTSNPKDSGYDYWGWYKTWGWVYIKDFTPQNKPGLWNVKYFVDGSEWISANFIVSYLFKENRMTKAVDGDNNPGTAVTEFSANDDIAYAWYKLESVADALKLKHKWYAPDGSLYFETTPATSQDPGKDSYWSSLKVSHGIYIKGTPAETKCGNWRVEAYIDDKLKYDQGFTIKDCAPPVECKAEALEAWVGKDGEIYNNIKTHHKFINNEGKALNYNINFDLFGPDGTKVGQWSSSGKLDPGWQVVWWVQYGVPSGGWKPGSYTSRASIDGYCGNYRVQKSNEAYPAIPAPAPPPGGGTTNFCDGAISVKVTDKFSNSLQSVKVYLDGNLEGTTSAEGKRNIVIADNGCGKVHAVKAVCPNDALCSEKTTTIDYDGDASALGFVCKCPGTVPGLDIQAGTDSFKYFKDSDIKLNALIKKADGSTVANSLLTIYDPFLGATKFFSLAEGALSYGSKAALPGLQAFFLSGYKQGFLPGLSKIKVVVEDFTGEITVQATHKDGTSLKSALVYLDDQFKGATDSTGSKTFSAEKGKVSVLALKCPGAKTDGPYCAGKDVAVIDNNFIPLSCDCGPEGTNKKGTILLQLKSKNCPPEFQSCPIGNALVSVDGQKIGYTPGYGFMELPGLKYGNRKVEITGLLTDNEDDETPELKRNITRITVDAPFKHIPLELRGEDFQVIKGAEAESMMSAENASEQFIIIPILIWVALTAWDAKQLHDCEKKYDYDPLVVEAECWDERLFLASNFIPLGTIFSKAGKGIKGLVHVLEFVDGKWVRKAVEVTRIGEAFQHAVRLFDRVHNVYKVVSEYGGRALGYVVRKTGLKEVIIVVNHVESIILRDWDAAVKAVQLKFLGKDTLQIGNTILKKADFVGESLAKTIARIDGEIGEAYAEEAFKQLAKKVDPNIAVNLIDKTALKAFINSEEEIVTAGYRMTFKPNGKSINVFAKDDITHASQLGEIDRLFDFQGKPVVIEAKLKDNIVYDPRHKIDPEKFPSDINPTALPHIMKATQELYVEKVLKNSLPELTEEELKRTIRPQYVVAGPSDVVKGFVRDPVNPALPSASWRSMTDDLIREGYENPLPLSFVEDFASLDKMAQDLARGGN